MVGLESFCNTIPVIYVHLVYKFFMILTASPALVGMDTFTCNTL